MSSVPSRISVNWSLGTLKENKSLTAIRFPSGWDSRTGPVFTWYKQLSCTKFKSIQHRKEREFPFYHEFLCVKLMDDSLCRFERFGDPDARADAITKEGSIAHDSAEILPLDQLTVLDNSSDIIEEVFFPRPLDLLDILKICYKIQKDKRTRAYTLQRYNCYFFCWCVLLLLVQDIAVWTNKMSASVWNRILQNFEASLRVVLPQDQDSHMLILYHTLGSDTARLRPQVIRVLCNELAIIAKKPILEQLNSGLEGTLWRVDYLAQIQNTFSYTKGAMFNQGNESPMHTGFQSLDGLAQTHRMSIKPPSLGFEWVRGWVGRAKGKLISRVSSPRSTECPSNTSYPHCACEGLDLAPRARRLHEMMTFGFGPLSTHLNTNLTKEVTNTGYTGGAYHHAGCAIFQQEVRQAINNGEVGATTQLVQGKMHVPVRFSAKAVDNLAILWPMLVADLLQKHLVPLVSQSLLNHDHQELQAEYALSKMARIREHVSVSRFQKRVRARIAAHASRVERMGLGSAVAIQEDIERTISGIWSSRDDARLARETYSISGHADRYDALRAAMVA